MKLYHATYSAYLDSILEKGLIPNYNTNWDFSERYIYLTSDPEIALYFAEAAEEVPEEYLDEIVIIEVNIEDLNVDKLRVDDNISQDEEEEPYSFQYKGTIDPELITIHDIIKNKR